MEFNSRVSWVQYCIEESTRWKNNRIILILDSKEKKETYFILLTKNFIAD